MNLMALRRLLPEAQLASIDINESAAHELRRIEGTEMTVDSLFDYMPPNPAVRRKMNSIVPAQVGDVSWVTPVLAVDLSAKANHADRTAR